MIGFTTTESMESFSPMSADVERMFLLGRSSRNVLLKE